MNEDGVKLIQSLPDVHLPTLALRLLDWLLADQGLNSPGLPAITESRARALLRLNGLLDEATLNRFQQLVAAPEGMRCLLRDLLVESGLVAAEGLPSVSHSTADVPDVPWLLLIVASFAWKNAYPLAQLDPASPPDPDSPAGLLLTRSAQLIRQQVLRTATERQQLVRKLAHRPGLDEGLPSGAGSEAIAPLPPHFRTPIPVRYPEVARETVEVNPDEPQPPAGNVARGEPITIREEDLADPGQTPRRMPPITIEREQLRPARPPSATRQERPRVTMPEAVTEVGNSLGAAVRQLFQREPMDSTRLRLQAQQYPDGPGFYGLQVRVTCAGVKSDVAGTTDRQGNFVCELPVPQKRGLTYDVDLTWPREEGGETERKSITLHADRTEFVLPFYRRLQP